MKCTCKADIEARLVERFKADYPEAQNVKLTIESYGLGLRENTMVVQGAAPIKYSALVPRKAGGTKQISRKASLVWSFCPFCGVPAR